MTTVVDIDEEPRKARPRILLVSLILALLVIAGLWSYAIWYSVAGPNPEEITQNEAGVIENTCVATAKTIQELPAMPVPPSDADVAARAKGETDALVAMVASLRDVHPKHRGGAQAFKGWLGDWEQVIGARRAYERNVRPGEDLVLPIEKGQPLTIRMNNFAESHGFQACDTTALGAENVDALRP